MSFRVAMDDHVRTLNKRIDAISSRIANKASLWLRRYRDRIVAELGKSKYLIAEGPLTTKQQRELRRLIINSAVLDGNVAWLYVGSRPPRRSMLGEILKSLNLEMKNIYSETALMISETMTAMFSGFLDFEPRLSKQELAGLAGLIMHGMTQWESFSIIIRQFIETTRRDVLNRLIRASTVNNARLEIERFLNGRIAKTAATIERQVSDWLIYARNQAIEGATGHLTGGLSWQ